jgi:hypothetical protein
MSGLIARVALLVVLVPAFVVRIDGSQLGGASSGQAPGVRVDLPNPSLPQFPGSPAIPAGDGPAGDHPGTSSSASTSSSVPSRGEILIVPIPFSNEAFSFGIVPVVAYVFRIDQQDDKSPPSTAGLAGLVATGNSWAIGGGGRFYLKADRFRLTGFAGTGDVGYDVFGVGSDSGDTGQAVPVRQGGSLVLLESLVRVKGNFYAGPRFNYRNLSASLSSSADNPPAGIDPNDLGSDVSAYAPGFKVQHDTRSDVYYPTSGHTLEMIGDFFSATRTSALLPEKELGYEFYQLSYNHYATLTSTQVLALRGTFCGVGGDPPFYELCLYGMHSDLRGYQAGRYRDRLMVAVQSEYRKTLGRRWGFVLFGGIGDVADTWDSFSFDDTLPAGGAGIRFNLSSKQRINLRSDFAYGKNGWSWNISLGEAF